MFSRKDLAQQSHCVWRFFSVVHYGLYHLIIVDVIDASDDVIILTSIVEFYRRKMYLETTLSMHT